MLWCLCFKKKKTFLEKKKTEQKKNKQKQQFLETLMSHFEMTTYSPEQEIENTNHLSKFFIVSHGNVIVRATLKDNETGRNLRQQMEIQHRDYLNSITDNDRIQKFTQSVQATVENDPNAYINMFAERNYFGLEALELYQEFKKSQSNIMDINPFQSCKLYADTSGFATIAWINNDNFVTVLKQFPKVADVLTRKSVGSQIQSEPENVENQENPSQQMEEAQQDRVHIETSNADGVVRGLYF